jgi:hypothetical protein
VVVFHTLPPNVTVDSIATTQGSCPGNYIGILTCYLGVLNAGLSAGITVRVTPHAPGVIQSTASVVHAYNEATASNNSSTISTTVNPDCTPRPRITQTVTRVGSGLLQVVATAQSTAGAPNNAISSIQFTVNGGNAAIQIPVGGATFTGDFTFPVSPPASSVTFRVQRNSPGAFTARYQFHDLCGAWSSFAGGGVGVP